MFADDSHQDIDIRRGLFYFGCNEATKGYSG
jgi:hypothetical protein